MELHWTFALVLVGTSLSAALSALVLLIALQGRQRGQDCRLCPDDAEGAVFLFDDETLVDANEAARALLASSAEMPGLARATAWARLSAFLAPSFADFQARMAQLAREGSVSLKAENGGSLHVQAQWRAGLARITVTDTEAEGASITMDQLSYLAQTEELATLRAAIDHAPALIWRQSESGAVSWANLAYLKEAGDAGPLRWPLPRLFPEIGPETVTVSGDSEPVRLKRGGTDDGMVRWFDCHVVKQPGGLLAFALPADAAAKSERARRDFVQTLTKTFASLPVGLAVFGQDRLLQVFNPALVELTMLEPDFLSSRPPLEAFLDRLRDKRVLPEPRDYRNWRKQIVDMERAAAAGLFEDTWCLPTGQTYRVTARPHPDNALALLIEDISAETTLGRRFRAEIETGRAVIDSMNDAVVVFSPSGTALMANAAYSRLWGTDPGHVLAEIGLKEALETWRALSLPNPVWDEISGFVAHSGPRDDWSGPVYLRDGRMLLLTARALPGGVTMVSFSGADGAQTPQPETATTGRHSSSDEIASGAAAGRAGPVGNSPEPERRRA